MTVQEVLIRCRDIGVTLAPGPEGKLRVAPPGKLPSALREELRMRKAEVLAVLLAEKAPSFPCSVCRKPAKVEEVDTQGRRVFWTCPHCQATGVTPREPGKPYITQEEPFPLKELYRQMTQDPLFDDFPLIDSWLCDNHPALWRKIRDLDNELSRLEKQGVSEVVYRAKLEELVSLCQQAQAMKESEQQKEGRRTLAVHHCGGARFWLSAYSGLWICEKCNPPGDKSSVKRWAEAGEPISEGVYFVQ